MRPTRKIPLGSIILCRVIWMMMVVMMTMMMMMMIMMMMMMMMMMMIELERGMIG